MIGKVDGKNIVALIDNDPDCDWETGAYIGYADRSLVEFDDGSQSWKYDREIQWAVHAAQAKE